MDTELLQGQKVGGDGEGRSEVSRADALEGETPDAVRLREADEDEVHWLTDLLQAGEYS